jgi:hypothetical protein
MSIGLTADAHPPVTVTDGIAAHETGRSTGWGPGEQPANLIDQRSHEASALTPAEGDLRRRRD